MMENRNAAWNEDGTINVEINHPRFGWIEFTANENDVEPLGIAIFEMVKDIAAPLAAE
jgi:hypothetical protein